jgi:hypothetical protein
VEEIIVMSIGVWHEVEMKLFSKTEKKFCFNPSRRRDAKYCILHPIAKKKQLGKM